MKNILITGSFLVGKSTTLDALEPKIPYNERLITRDLARHYMESNRLDANTMTDTERKDMQLVVASGYIGSIKEASHAKVKAVMAGSLIEAYAYADGILPEVTMDRIAEKLMDYQEHSIAYVIPPTIPLENDGLRHTSKEFRIYIHKRIMEIIEAFGIPYQYVTSQGAEERANEILYLHNQ